jgi:hypothetical protein
MQDIAGYAESVSFLGPSEAMPVLILVLSWAFSAVHVFEEWKGSSFPLWRAFGAIEGVYVPNWLGFLFFTIGLLLILFIVGVGGIVGFGIRGPLTAQQGVFWLGALIGGIVSDCIFSHWTPYLAGYRPNPGIRSTALYALEAVLLLLLFWKGLSEYPPQAILGGLLGTLFFLAVWGFLVALRLCVPSWRRAPWGQRRPNTLLGDNQSFAASPWFSLESESLLRRLWRVKANALQFEHTGLRFRAARRGETADLATRGQHSVTGNDQGHRIFGHRLADVARRFAAGADLLRQRSIGGCAPPADPAQGVVNLRKERVLAREVELNLTEVRFLAGEIPLRRLDDRRNDFRRRARLRAKGAAAYQPFCRFGGFRRQLKARNSCIAPRDRAAAHGGLEDVIMPYGLAHGTASGFVIKETCAVEPQIQPDSCDRIHSSG